MHKKTFTKAAQPESESGQGGPLPGPEPLDGAEHGWFRVREIGAGEAVIEKLVIHQNPLRIEVVRVVHTDRPTAYNTLRNATRLQALGRPAPWES